MNTKAPPIPIIHLNGTSSETLKREYQRALDGIRDAKHIYAAVTVNGRDYYPGGQELIGRATEHRQSVLLRLKEMEAEIIGILQGIYDQDK